MAPLEARTSRGYWTRLGCLGVMFGTFGGIFAWSGLRRLAEPGPMGAVLLVLAVGVAFTPFLLVLNRRNWVRRIDDQGVLLRGGARLAWSDFERVATVRVRTAVNHYELRFRTGVARIFPAVLENSDEVMAFVRKLEHDGRFSPDR